MALAIHEEGAWSTFVPSCRALTLMIGLLLLSERLASAIGQHGGWF